MPLGLIGGGIALATGASLGTAAAVGIAGAAIGGTVMGAINAGQSHDIASSQLAMSETIFGEQQGFEQQLAALLKDPSSVTKLPGYAFNLQQGSGTVAREMSASGFFGSGNEAGALMKYGQDYATNAYMTQANLLMQLSGITAPSSPSQAGGVATGAQSSSAHQWDNLFQQLAMTSSYLGGKYGSAGGPPPASGGGGGGDMGGMTGLI